jgi:hypothetical protein
MSRFHYRTSMHYNVSLSGYVPTLKPESEYSLQRLVLLNAADGTRIMITTHDCLNIKSI